MSQVSAIILQLQKIFYYLLCLSSIKMVSFAMQEIPRKTVFYKNSILSPIKKKKKK